MTYPDAEALMVSWLRTTFPAARVCTETPANLADVLPCLAVNGIGGGGDLYQFDTARVDVDVFHSSRTAAREYAHDVRASLLQDLPGESIDGTFVLAVHEFTRPTWAPYDNTSLRRFVVGVELRLHNRT